MQVPAQQTLKEALPYPCLEWRKTQGNCKYGTNCKFLHPELDLSIDTEIPRKNRSKNAAGKPKRIKKKNARRNKIFCYWLVNEFGLNKESGEILDIAGGQGEVSFILKNIFQISSTIIDPREQIDYSKFKVKFKCGNYHSKEMNKNVEDIQNSIIEYPSHIKLFFKPILWECVLDIEEETCLPENYEKDYKTYLNFRKNSNEYSKIQFFENLIIQAKNCWNSKTLLNSTKEINIICETNEKKTNFDDSNEIKDTFDVIYDLFNNFSCIIGMHPDQATEAIVDFAILFNKSFAVVPCCVCSKQFSKRMYDGKLVKNYDDLINHLLSKSPKIQKTTLPFPGKNTVLYYHGDSI